MPSERLRWQQIALRFQRMIPARGSLGLARIIAGVFLSVILILSAASHALAQEAHRRIATGGLTELGLNEFDLALWCGQREDRPGAPLARSRFGFAALSTGHAPEFVYIASDYYVELGPHGDPGDCKFKGYLYRLDKAGEFKREVIGEKRFAQVLNDLQANARTFEKSNPGQYLDPSVRDIGESGYVALSCPSTGFLVGAQDHWETVS